MEHLSTFLEQHGAVFVFVSVLAQQLGVPIPAIPAVLAAGALAGSGKLDVRVAIGLAVVASLPGDLLWYYLGRRRGHSVLKTLCRLSIEPDSCVRRTETVFVKHGPASLLVARFVPGLSTVATPLAGVFKVGFKRFLAYDLAGAIIWTVVYVGLGYAFSDQLEYLAGGIARLGSLATVLVVAAVAGYFVFKFVERRRVLRQLRILRIDVDELKRLIDARRDVFVVDLRSAADVEIEPFRIPGALRVDIDNLTAAGAGVPRDREIVIYCT